MKYIIHFSAIVALSFFVSCSPAYIPNKVNTGLLSDKGELHAEIATGTSGYDPQVAYAVTENVLVTGNASFKDTPFESTLFVGKDDFNYEGTQKLRSFELGLGYYKKLKDGFILEMVAGYGLGKVSDTRISILTFDLKEDELRLVDGETALFNSDYSKSFLQPTVGISHKNFDIGITSKFTNVKMEAFDLRFNDWFFEPALTMRLGLESVKFTSQIGFSLPMTTVEYYSEPFIISIGIMADLNILGIRKKD